MKLIAFLSSMLAVLDARAGGESAANPAPNPVVLIHGIYSSSGDFRRMARYLQSEGREVFAPDLKPSTGVAGIDELAQQLAAFADEKLPGKKFDLVGFSMGGLVSRYYLQRLGGLDRVEHFVSLAAPHHGTVLAELHQGRGGRQMRPASPLLRDLDRDADRLSQIKFTSFYTPLDLVILPARSSVMPQAQNVRLWAALHPSLILEKRCIRAVAEALRE